MSTLIRSTRLAQQVSVSTLAERLGVTPSAVSQLEKSEAEGTIKLNSLKSALSALDRTLFTASFDTHPLTPFAPYRVAEAMSDALLAGKETLALRILNQSLDELTRHQSEFAPEAFEVPPRPLPDHRWNTLFKAVYAHALGGKKPSWAVANRLTEPWFISQFPSLRERAKTTTPAYLRTLNIFIDGRSLSAC